MTDNRKKSFAGGELIQVRRAKLADRAALEQIDVIYTKWAENDDPSFDDLLEIGEVLERWRAQR